MHYEVLPLGKRSADQSLVRIVMNYLLNRFGAPARAVAAGSSASLGGAREFLSEASQKQ
jgi:hypothetical protein